MWERSWGQRSSCLPSCYFPPSFFWGWSPLTACCNQPSRMRSVFAASAEFDICMSSWLRRCATILSCQPMMMRLAPSDECSGGRAFSRWLEFLRSSTVSLRGSLPVCSSLDSLLSHCCSVSLLAVGCSWSSLWLTSATSLPSGDPQSGNSKCSFLKTDTSSNWSKTESTHHSVPLCSFEKCPHREGTWMTDTVGGLLFFSAIFELLFDLAYFVNAKWALITLPKTTWITAAQFGLLETL